MKYISGPMNYKMQAQKILVSLLLVVPIFLAGLCYNGYSQSNKIDAPGAYNVDSIVGEFLYEANVPSACYTIGDAGVQGHSIIPTCDTCDIDVEKIYKEGLLMTIYAKPILGLYDPGRMNRIYRERSVSSLWAKLDFPSHAFDSTYLNGLTRDKSGILMYKRFYAKIKFVNFGVVECLIPDIRSYKCCNANKKMKLTLRAVVDVTDVKML